MERNGLWWPFTESLTRCYFVFLITCTLLQEALFYLELLLQESYCLESQTFFDSPALSSSWTLCIVFQPTGSDPPSQIAVIPCSVHAYTMCAGSRQSHAFPCACRNFRLLDTKKKSVKFRTCSHYWWGFLNSKISQNAWTVIDFFVSNSLKSPVPSLGVCACIDGLHGWNSGNQLPAPLCTHITFRALVLNYSNSSTSSSHMAWHQTIAELDLSWAQRSHLIQLSGFNWGLRS